MKDIFSSVVRPRQENNFVHFKPNLDLEGNAGVLTFKWLPKQNNIVSKTASQNYLCHNWTI